ncbi:MAG: 2-C-methyl-D-erythritol 4-phosphate cytidylyltransferase, partial [Mailhella sp.]|nr:2-C-methyl-D-erythritol 4-phosphate cytidylyltransferase [Mailhella sp.]
MQKECWGIILAAGQGRRMAEATGGEAKQFLLWKGAPLWWHSALAMAAAPRVHGLVFVFPPEKRTEAEAELIRLDRTHPLGVKIAVAEGGNRRQDSVRHGLTALPEECAHVLVHDSARPFLSTALVSRLIAELDEHPGLCGVIPGLAVTDTIKEVDDDAIVTHTPERAFLRAVQTPQAFPLDELRMAHFRAEEEGWDVTDDASLMERCELPVRVIEGD